MPEQQCKPLVTVITVTYNSGAYVAETIKSILQSSYTHIQLIIADDCSTDNTWEIVQSFFDSRILAYRNEVNSGEYVNRNKALTLAQGEYVIYIDGDDMIYQHGLEFMVTQATHHPECGMALMHSYINWIFMPVKISPSDFYVSNYLSQGFNSIAFTNTLFLTNALKEISGIPTTYRAGDVYVRLRIASKYPSLIIQDQLTWWRETPGQASFRISKDVMYIIENLEMHQDILRLSGQVLNHKQREQAEDNELVRFRAALLQLAKKGQIRNVMILISYLVRKKILLRLLRVKKHIVNPFAQYGPSSPLRMN